MQAFIGWFPPQIWTALTMVVVACGFDLALTLLLVAVGRGPGPFDWRRLLQFLVTNVLPLLFGAILGAVAVKANPELGTDYLALVGSATAILNRGVRDKLKLLIGLPPVDNGSVAPPTVTRVTTSR